MKFGFCLMADVTEIGLFSHAETLGYSSVWAADSQMLFSDCYAVMALAARQTTRLRIGPVVHRNPTTRPVRRPPTFKGLTSYLCQRFVFLIWSQYELPFFACNHGVQ
jgi:hypothetical protein